MRDYSVGARIVRIKYNTERLAINVVCTFFYRIIAKVAGKT